jgi:hypothetical protein
MPRKKKVERIPPLIKIRIKTMKIPINGRTNFIMNKLSDKVRKGILAKQTGKNIKPKQQRNLSQEVQDAIHKLSNGNVGFPASGFQTCIVEMAKSKHLDIGVDGKLVKGAVRICSEDPSGNIPIKFEKMEVQETWGRGGDRKGTPLTIVRPQFINWSCILPIQYDSTLITAEQIINLLNYAGWHIGMGAWSPRNGGTFGMFEVDVKKLNDA